MRDHSMYLIRGFYEWMFVRDYHYKGFLLIWSNLRSGFAVGRGRNWMQIDCKLPQDNFARFSAITPETETNAIIYHSIKAENV